jgi:hypothetical protein
MTRLTKIMVVLVIIALLSGGALAATAEVTPRANFWTEFDITFWQTIPWTAFWSYAAASQLARGGEVNWSPVINVALIAALGNAYLHARQVTK